MNLNSECDGHYCILEEMKLCLSFVYFVFEAHVLPATPHLEGSDIWQGAGLGEVWSHFSPSVRRDPSSSSRRTAENCCSIWSILCSRKFSIILCGGCEGMAAVSTPDTERLEPQLWALASLTADEELLLNIRSNFLTPASPCSLGWMT